MNVSDTKSLTAWYKIFSKTHSSKSDIKVILVQALLIYFLLTELSPGLLGSNCFCDMTNYESKSIVILEIYKDTIKETYV